MAAPPFPGSLLKRTLSDRVANTRPGTPGQDCRLRLKIDTPSHALRIVNRAMGVVFLDQSRTRNPLSSHFRIQCCDSVQEVLTNVPEVLTNVP